MTHGEKKSLCVLLALVFAVSAVGHATAGKNEPDTASWNILCYLQADNNLNDLTQEDLDEFMAVGSSDEVNVLVLMDKLDAPAYMYYIVPGDMVLLEDYAYSGEEINTGDPAVFEDFLVYTETNYPAEHTLIFFWDHGSPTAGVGVDETTPEGVRDWLTHHEVIDVLKDHTVEVLAMDECSIGQIEVAVEYARNLDTEYLVASESYIGYRGFPYDWILERLVDEPDMTPFELSVVCVEEFERLFMTTPYRTEILTTQSVIALDQIELLAAEFGHLLNALITDLPEYEGIIGAAQREAIMPWGARSMGTIDLPTFVQAIAEAAPENSEVEQNAMDVLEVYESAVPAMGGTMNSEKYGYQGLGILFPQSASFLTISYASMFEVYKTFDFPDDGWLQFLEAYWGVDLI
ncbi:MAG: clostripain-related cysteine peptidase [Thermoplasmata archaeon]